MKDLGTYVDLDGRPAVRFQRDYSHNLDRLWRAVTDPTELAHWFPSNVSFEPRAGGEIEFTGDPYADDVTGRVLVWDPPHRFTFSWGPDEIHLELAPTEQGCRLVLLNVLDAEDTAARNAAGWYVCLAELDLWVDGVPGKGPHDSELPFEPLLEAHRNAGLPSGAEIPTA